MPYTQIISKALALGALAFSAIATFWVKILDWAKDSLFPWIEKNLPTLIDLVQDAFTWVDAKVMVPTRQIVKRAWSSLRKHLLKMAVYFERQSPSEWIRRMTSWAIEVLNSAEPKVKKIEVVEEVNWDDLPQEVRKSWMKNNESSHELDITEVRDQQITEMSN
ncbi:MAG: hypothetical protein IGR80_09155 [Synechococcales cyanobacterium K44_A2020_017]|nr:hypothetical protein [Synechococcales cyanobacterium K32_A2020_035]MBF2094912.1 hypothetical protein [Synechococcales cyanobacterium K44_A2020_017]